MKYLSLIFLLFYLLSSCKKDAGKHCPLIVDSFGDHDHVDITSVKNFPGVMDTLVKYPQLKVVRVNVTRAIYDTTHYSANILCKVYDQGLIIFDYYYSLFSNNYGPSDNYFPGKKIPADLPVSTTPAISLEKANQIAKDAVYFKHCTISALGFKNYYNTDSLAYYKLIWRIRSTDGYYPKIEIDAQSGEILTLIKNSIPIE